MQDWIEEPFKSVIAGTVLMFIVAVALSAGISFVGSFL